jgi:isopentenyl-diphosphate delta-isomerase
MKKQFYIVLFQCFKQQNEIMLQQRASQNTIRHCYGPTRHQRDGETNIQAGSRRLFEEMGFNTELSFSFYL